MTSRTRTPSIPGALALATVLVGTVLLAAATSASAAEGDMNEAALRAELAAFRDTITGSVTRYAAAYHNTSLDDDGKVAEMRAASGTVGDAFLRFESGHRDADSLNTFVQERMPASFYSAFERQIVLLRGAMRTTHVDSATSPSDVEAQGNIVQLALARLESCVPDGCRTGPVGPAVESYLLVVREGFEAILLVGAVIAYLHKSNHPDKVKHVVAGVGAALGLTLVTWFAVDLLFDGAESSLLIGREVLEGATMLLAAGVLFYISYWLVSKVETQRWIAFIDGKVKDSIVHDKRWVLPAVGFLAVYREGLETVLFLQAITLRNGADAYWGIAGGVGLGAVTLVALYMAINRLGLKIPLRTFFSVTSALLFLMAIRFMGLGVFALQEAGVLTPTPLLGLARIIADHPFLAVVFQDLLGFAPTLEVLLAQGVLVAAAVGGAFWQFRLAKPVPHG